MSEEHSPKTWSSLNEAFKSYEPTRAGITPKTHKNIEKIIIAKIYPDFL